MTSNQASFEHSNFIVWTVTGLSIALITLGLVYANFIADSGSFLSGEKQCSDLEFGQGSELVMNKTSGTIYENSDNYQQITSVPLENGEAVTSASDKLIVTTKGHVFRTTNISQPRLIGRLPTENIVGITNQSIDRMCTQSMPPNCSTLYTFSTLSEDGKISRYSLNKEYVETASSTDTTKQLESTHTENPRFNLRDNEEFRAISGRFSRLTITTTHGVYQLDDSVYDEEAKAKATTTLEFSQPIDILDIVQEAKEEKIYAKTGQIYQANSSGPLVVSDTLPEQICNLE